MATRKQDRSIPWIIPESCEGCADCAGICPKKCIVMVETSEGVFVPWIDDIDKCNGCGKCESVCPWMAISLTAYVDLARERLRTRRPPALGA